MLTDQVLQLSDLSVNYQKRIFQLTKNSFGSHVDTDEVKAIIENLLRLEIFYKEFNYEEIQEMPAYPVSAALP